MSEWNVNVQRMIDLVDHTLAAGMHQLRWDGLDRAADWLPNGVYFVRLETNVGTATTKLTLLH